MIPFMILLLATGVILLVAVLATRDASRLRQQLLALRELLVTQERNVYRNANGFLERQQSNYDTDLRDLQEKLQRALDSSLYLELETIGVQRVLLVRDKSGTTDLRYIDHEIERMKRELEKHAVTNGLAIMTDLKVNRVDLPSDPSTMPMVPFGIEVKAGVLPKLTTGSARFWCHRRVYVPENGPVTLIDDSEFFPSPFATGVH